MSKGVIYIQNNQHTLKIILSRDHEEEYEEEKVSKCNYCLNKEKEMYSFICYFCKKKHCLNCIILNKRNCHFVLLKEMNQKICKECLKHLLARDIEFERITETLKIKHIKDLEIECYQIKKEENLKDI